MTRRFQRKSRRASIRGQVETLENRLLLATDVFPFSEATITLQVGTGPSAEIVIIDVAGQTTITRDDVPGDAIGPNGLDDVGIQVDELNLGGIHPLYGPVSAVMPLTPLSTGFAEEEQNLLPGQLEAPLLSQIDLYLHIDVNSLPGFSEPFQGIAEFPIPLEANLTQYPPQQFEPFFYSGDPIELLNEFGGEFDPPVFLVEMNQFLDTGFGDQPPILQIVDPPNGAQVEAGETILVDLFAFDDMGITQVQLVVDGVFLPPQFEEPFQFPVPVPPLPGQTILLEAFANDTAGQEGFDLIILNIVDTMPPELLLPPGVILEFGEDELPPATGFATAVDSVDPQPVIEFEDAFLPGSCIGEHAIGRVWRATDSSGNIAEETQFIQVIDTTPPDLILPPDVLIPFGASIDPADTGFADAFDLAVRPQVDFSDVVVPGTGDISEIITRTWTAVDDCGNLIQGDQTISIMIDDQPPVVTFLDPLNNDPVEAGTTITVQIQAIDDLGIPQVDLLLGGVPLGPPLLAPPYDFQLPIPPTPGLTLQLQAIATDDDQQSTSAFIELPIVDTTPPQILLPPDTLLQFGDDDQPPATGVATATDTVDPAPQIEFLDLFVPGGCVGEHTIERTWTATDDSGNQAAGVQTIQVIDTIFPELILPPDLLLPFGSSIDPLDTGFALGSDLAGPPLIEFSDLAEPGTGDISEIITRTWTATDDCGNSVSGDQTITIAVDDQPPSVSFIDPVDNDQVEAGTTITVEVAANDDLSIPRVELIVDGNPLGVLTSPPFEFQLPIPPTPGISLQLEAIATDDDQQSTSELIQVQVVDTTPPSIVVPPDQIIEFGETVDPIFTGEATAIDSVDPAPTITFSDVIQQGACSGDQTIVRTWTATDASGNESTGVQLLFIADTTPPDLQVPPDTRVEFGASTDPLNTGFADGSDLTGPPLIDFSDLVVPGTGDVFEIITRTWIATDSCGNFTAGDQTITVSADDQPPTVSFINPLDNDPVEAGTTFLVEIAANDDLSIPRVELLVNGDPLGVLNSPPYEFQLPIPPSPGLTLQLQAIATDDDQQSTTASIVVDIVDTTPPLLTLPADVTLEFGEDDQPPATGVATAEDSIDPAPVILFNDTFVPGVCTGTHTIERLWSATDASGNSSQATQLVRVVDTTAPVLTLPADVTVTEGDDISPAAIGMATATDLAQPLTITFSDSSVPGSPPLVEVITRAWTATDPCGNESSGSQTISVEPANDPPSPFDTRVSTREHSPNGTIVHTVDPNDPNPDDTHTFAIVGGNQEGVFQIDSGGTISVLNNSSLDHETFPVFTLQVLVTDNGGLTGTAEIIVDVTDVNEAPIAIDDTFIVDPLVGIDTLDVLANDVDVDTGDTLTITSVTSPSPFGSAVINGNQIEVDFDSLGATGVTTFDYTISDGNGGTDSATVTVVVSNSACTVTAGHLFCVGTPAGDRIVLSPTFAGVLVQYNLTFLGPFPNVTSMEVLGLAGNDQIITRHPLGGTFDGGAGNDYLQGSPDDDLMIGGSGNDRILAGEGNNVIYGDEPGSLFLGGNDNAQGRSGNDIILGGPGNDRLLGLAGDDVLSGGAGRDELFGGLGDDLSFDSGGGDIEVIRDEGGNDVIFGGGGSDRLDGGVGDDLIIGGFGGEEWIRGNNGNDALINGSSSLETSIDQALAEYAAGDSTLFDSVVLPGLTAWRNSRSIAFGSLIDDGQTDTIIGGVGNDQIDAEDGIDDIRQFDPSEDTRI